MNQGKRVNSEQNIYIIRCPGGGGETAPFRPAFALAMLTVAAAAALFTLPPNLVVNAQGGAIALPTLLQAARCGSATPPEMIVGVDRGALHRTQGDERVRARRRDRHLFAEVVHTQG